MMTKGQVTDYAIENDLWVTKRSELEYLLDEYSQSLAKEVIEELEKYYSLGIAIDIIKQKFNIK